MPKEYIARDAAIIGLAASSLTPHQIDDAAEAIQLVPAADVVEVRHGSFLGTEFDGYADGNPVYYEWQCSVCGCIFEDEEPTYNYGPYCGAKMDETEPPKEEG